MQCERGLSLCDLQARALCRTLSEFVWAFVVRWRQNQTVQMPRPNATFYIRYVDGAFLYNSHA